MRDIREHGCIGSKVYLGSLGTFYGLGLRHQAGVMKRRLNRPQPFDQDEVVYDQKWCPTEANPNGHDIYTAE